MIESIRVRPVVEPAPFEAMQLTSENRSQFLEWAAKVCGVSGHQFRYDMEDRMTEGYVWLGNRGDDRDVRVTLGEWVVVTSQRPKVMSTPWFKEHYIRVS